MNKKPKGPNRVLNFLEGRGFYIILFLCVAAIGISGYVLLFSPGDTDPAADGADYLLNLPVEDTMEVPANQPALVEIPEEKPAAADQKAQAASSPAKIPVADVKSSTAKEASPAYLRPVSGETIKSFSGNNLVYSATMGDYRTHAGLDLKASAGDRVQAVAAGSVSDVFFDDMLGYCIRIRHDNELESLYAGLAQKTSVAKGDTVSAGDVIGSIGDSNMSESSDPSHLHLEMTRSGNPIDPEGILPKK